MGLGVQQVILPRLGLEGGLSCALLGGEGTVQDSPSKKSCVLAGRMGVSQITYKGVAGMGASHTLGLGWGGGKSHYLRRRWGGGGKSH